MVITVLSGGLGSQLWQYSAGVSLANKKKCLLIIDASWYYNKKLNTVNDDRYLNFFELLNLQKIIVIKSIHISRALRALLILTNIISFGLIKFRKINIKNVFKYEKFPEATNYFINGFPNNLQYYEDSYEETLKKIKIKKIKTDKTVIGIHARKGIDVIDGVLDFCDKDYYLRAVEKIINLNRINKKKIKIKVFSENLDWCKNNLVFEDIETNYIIGDDKSAIEDIKKMMECDHFIFPNSAFGWWAGAYVDSINKGTVICPDLWWDKVPVNKINIYPSNWIVLKTNVEENKNPQYQF